MQRKKLVKLILTDPKTLNCSVFCINNFNYLFLDLVYKYIWSSQFNQRYYRPLKPKNIFIICILGISYHVYWLQQVCWMSFFPSRQRWSRWETTGSVSVQHRNKWVLLWASKVAHTTALFHYLVSCLLSSKTPHKLADFKTLRAVSLWII